MKAATTFLVISLAMWLFLAWQNRLNLKRYRVKLPRRAGALRLEDTPTLSLCIPARNETHALEDCLSNAIASDYPKLEIIVLDDCSQDRTSEIIRQFAHDGVRFVKGVTPSDSWLGKNQAYEILAREARGEYLAFMSVDTRLAPNSLALLIDYMLDQKISMASVLPRRTGGWQPSRLLAPVRYFWQVTLPPWLNVPAATSLWAIRADSLADTGGFRAYKAKIMLENNLAQQFFKQNRYHFLVACDYFKVRYAKKWSSQVETAIRLWYPSLGHNILGCVLAAMLHLLLFVWPTLALIVALANDWIELAVLSLTVILLECALFLSYLRRVQSGLWPYLGALLLPIVGLQEIALIMISAYQYKRGRVSWKGRNVCYPRLLRTR